MRRACACVGAMAFLVVNAQSMVLTLSAVEMITSFAVPLSCIFAYNTPINGCEIGDFTSGQCSPNCKRALQRVETNIRASCDTVDAPPGSLIGEAQRGNLVNALCKGVPPKQTSTRTQPPSTPSTPSTTPVSSITTTSPVSSSTSPLYTLTTSTTTLTSTLTTTPTASSTSTDSSSSSETESQTETGPISTTSDSSQETTTAAERSTSSSSSTSATKTAKPTRNPEAGAGDPFANVPNASRQLGPYIWGVVMVIFVICLM